MSDDLATHVSLLAAPIYAAMIARVIAGNPIPASELQDLRRHAIVQAQALWLDVQEAKLS